MTDDPDMVGTWFIGALVCGVLAVVGIVIWEAYQNPEVTAWFIGVFAVGLGIPYGIGRLVLRWLV